MARPKKDLPPNVFTSTELALAGGLTPRSFATLVENDLAPAKEEDSGGKNTSGQWNTNAVGYVAMTGAFYSCGVDLLMSAKISREILGEFVSTYGFLPSRLFNYFDGDAKEGSRFLAWLRSENLSDSSIHDDYWVHRYMRAHTNAYTVNSRFEGDFIVEIVDKRLVFTSLDFRHRKVVPRLSPWGATASTDPEMALEILDWGRGKAASTRAIHDIVDFAELMDNPEEKRRAQAIEKSWLKAREDAVGSLRINASLAIRNAFDAIHDHRNKSGLATPDTS